MWTRSQLYDAQSAFSFLVQQLAYIEPEVYRIRYPSYDFASLIPVDSSAPEWVKTIVFFSLDEVGKAKFISGYAGDIPYADVVRGSASQDIWMAGIGYEYNVEEINTARLQNINITNDKASAAREAYLRFMYSVAFTGDTEKAIKGLFNNASVTAGNVAADGTGSAKAWTTKTPTLILRDVNDLLSGIYTDTLTVEMADTLLLPIAAYNYIAQTPVSSNYPETILTFLLRTNTYTTTTGAQLTIRAHRALATAGAAGDGRMVAYRRDPTVLKLHLPMPHRFLPVWQNGPLNFMVPGIFRTGGVEVRRPGAVRYADGITV